MTVFASDSGVYVAAVEGGGTTFVASIAEVLPPSSSPSSSLSPPPNVVFIGRDRLRIVRTQSFPPSSKLSWSPERILKMVAKWLNKHSPTLSGGYAGVGVTTFGPAGVDPSRESTYGTILGGSPKREWRNVDVLTPILDACGIDRESGAYAFETDVNAPAYAEFVHRSAGWAERGGQPQDGAPARRRPTSCAYVTVGTGVGVGLVINSKPVHGMLHPEGGHLAVRVLPEDPSLGYSWGVEKSPYGGVGTVEGISSSVALTERYMRSDGSPSRPASVDAAATRDVLATLPDDHPVWKHAANALANLCTSLILLTSMETIVLGGGVMRRKVLYDMVRKRTWELLNGYLDGLPEMKDELSMEELIVESSWGEQGGVIGAFALALDARREREGSVDNDHRGVVTKEKKMPELVAESQRKPELKPKLKEVALNWGESQPSANDAQSYWDM